ncbi:MAG: DUF120 domain-containing protein [Dehalococcoidales bacterium]
MGEKKVYRGIVATGRGAGAGVMSSPGVLAGFEQAIGLKVIPGTLNAGLTEPFDLSLLSYIRFADVGLEIDLAAVGIDFDGEPGAHYGRIVVAGGYAAAVLSFTWTADPTIYAELVSPHHFRDTLGLADGDTIEFTLGED